MQSVIYGGDVCGISLQFRRKRHVLDINFCVVSDISFSREHHTNHTVKFFDMTKDDHTPARSGDSGKCLSPRPSWQQQPPLCTLVSEAVLVNWYSNCTSVPEHFLYYSSIRRCSAGTVVSDAVLVHWYSSISSGTLVSEAWSWRSVPEHNSARNLRQNWDSSSKITWLVNNGKVSEFYLGYFSSDLMGLSQAFCQPTHWNCRMLALNCYGFDYNINYVADE